VSPLAFKFKIIKLSLDGRAWPNLAQFFRDYSWRHGSIFPFLQFLEHCKGNMAKEWDTRKVKQEEEGEFISLLLLPSEVQFA
jgi:hypothetical protein